jgi:hypothetical protein
LLERHAAAGFDAVEFLVSTPDPERFVGVMADPVLPQSSAVKAV